MENSIKFVSPYWDDLNNHEVETLYPIKVQNMVPKIQVDWALTREQLLKEMKETYAIFGINL